jgi:hypothetical protein
MQHAVCLVSVAKNRFGLKKAGKGKKASKDAGVTK